ncbi:hypothetical protein [Clostridium sp. CCUG 7971]|uniref:hypothetical protein n=1 Tax=Clostridium sp. CCUG 7971 TaxID=2811414 RepID=UPI001ABB1DB2|nr:hypothetical protein [Clostridium sp. CCUG 7971]MBO3445700.1 hypothetical protein [Clostridium sp. CCUG 7971]
MEKLEQLQYINDKLKEGYSLTKISKEFGVGRSVIADRFKKINYAYANIAMSIYITTVQQTLRGL